MERSILQGTRAGAIVKVTAIARPIKAPLFNKDGMKIQQSLSNISTLRRFPLTLIQIFSIDMNLCF